jgi:hypothetical protein
VNPQVPAELSRLWGWAVQGGSPNGKSDVERELVRLRQLYSQNREAFSENELKVIDVAKVLLGLQDRIQPRFLPRQTPDNSGNLYFSVRVPSGKTEVVIVSREGQVSLASMIPDRRRTHCYRCHTFLDERDSIPKCPTCRWMICPECHACGCQYAGEERQGEPLDMPF